MPLHIDIYLQAFTKYVSNTFLYLSVFEHFDSVPPRDHSCRFYMMCEM